MTSIKITCTDYMYRRNSIGCVVNIDEMLKVGEAIFKNVHLRGVWSPENSRRPKCGSPLYLSGYLCYYMVGH